MTSEGGAVVGASHQGSVRQQMRALEDVEIMVALYAQGWESRRVETLGTAQGVARGGKEMTTEGGSEFMSPEGQN